MTPSSPTRRLAGSLAMALIAVLATAACQPAPPPPKSCATPVHYSTTSNTIYLVAPNPYGGPWTLAAIKVACPLAPLAIVDANSLTWELSADLIVQQGLTLQLHGSGAAVPGDVNTLRLRSLADNAKTDVSTLQANWGDIDIDSVHLTSWDDAAQAPDTVFTLPAGAAPTDRGRAFIKVDASLAADGVTPQPSRLDIANSEVDHLGYYGAEAYGVSFKTLGCSHADADIPVCQKVAATGSEANSRFHDNFMGTYTWGVNSMTFTGNSYDHNYGYGLDTHDVSDNLTVEHNHFSYNGDHGFICSQRCDSLDVTYNESDHNGMVPYVGPDPNGDGAGPVHGIMLHRGVTNATIAHNDVHDQPNGAGIAIFDSNGDTVSDNQVTANEYGVRLSVGASNNVVSDNGITGSLKYGIYTYVGSDLPSYTTPSGQPTGNHFTGNTVTGDGDNPVKLSNGSTANVFQGNTFGDAPSDEVIVQSGVGDVFAGNTFPAGQQFAVTGAPSAPSSVSIVDPAAPVAVGVDAFSTVDVTSSHGGQFTSTPTGPVTTDGPTGSDLLVPAAPAGTTAFAIAPTPISVGTTGSVTSTVGVVSGTTAGLTVTTPTGGQAITISIGGFAPGAAVTVTANGTALAPLTADASGTVQFSDTPATGSTAYLAVSS